MAKTFKILLLAFWDTWCTMVTESHCLGNDIPELQPLLGSNFTPYPLTKRSYCHPRTVLSPWRAPSVLTVIGPVILFAMLVSPYRMCLCVPHTFHFTYWSPLCPCYCQWQHYRLFCRNSITLHMFTTFSLPVYWSLILSSKMPISKW